MTDEDGLLDCDSALGPLSIYDTKVLRQWVLSPPEEKRFGYSIGGNWFCPACASSTTEVEPGLLVCDGCGRYLAPLMGMFVERFPHRNA